MLSCAAPPVMASGGKHGQHVVPFAIGIEMPNPAEDALAILPQNLKVAISVSVEPG